MEHPWRNADWDSVRVFLAVADTGSFRKAADTLNTGINTVRRVIQRLEDQVGFALLYREVEGARLTPEGRRVVVAARDVEASVNDMWRVAAASANTMAGPVRLAITEGLGTFWLTPRLVQYLDEGDGLTTIDLQCAMRSVDVMRLEADISVQLVEPKNPDLIRYRLGYLHMIPFASPEYLARRGTPAQIMDVVNHRVVEQYTDQLSHYSLTQIYGPEMTRRMVRFRTNFSSAQYWAVAKGAGLGLMPNYSTAIGGRLVHVDFGVFFRVEIWLATHPEIMKSPRHSAFIEWLKQSFDARQFPWFGRDFMTPAQISETMAAQNLQDYFTGFVASRW